MSITRLPQLPAVILFAYFGYDGLTCPDEDTVLTSNPRQPLEASSFSAEKKQYTFPSLNTLQEMVTKYKLYDKQVGLWSLNGRNSHGIIFLYGIALDYFRCPGIPSQRLVSKEVIAHGNPNAPEFIIAQWLEDDLPRAGYHLIAHENYVYLYQRRDK